MKKLISISVICCLTVAANAQSRSSFLNVTSITGLSFTQLSGDTFRLAITPGATFTHNSTVYAIQDVFGVWNLNNSMTGLNASAAAQNGWTYNESNNPDDIAGWKTNPPNAMANGTLDFTYSTLTHSNVNQAGFHVRLSSQNFPGTSGVTGYIALNSNPVPEPASMAALGIGAVALLRRRRKTA